MGKVISFISPKGGSAKSTLTLAIAHSRPFAKLNCCILEADAQGSLSGWYAERQDEGRKGGRPVFAEYDENRLKGELMKLARKHDVVFVDFPGESEALTRTRLALVYSDIVVIPVKADEFDLASVGKHTLPLIPEARKASTKSTKYFILPVMVHHAARKDTAVAQFQDTSADVLYTVMTFRKVYADFPAGGLTLKEYSEVATPRGQRKHAKRAMGEIDNIASGLAWHIGLQS